MSSRDWKDRTPHLGARGLAWAERRIAVVVAQLIAKEKDASAVEFHQAELVAWFVERIPSYVCWLDDKEYHGKRWGCGGWQVVLSRHDLLTALRDLEAAAERRLRQAEAARYPTLDAWLGAEVRGDLAAPAAEEPDAYDLLRNRQQQQHTAASERWLDTRHRLERRWPRTCRTCGGEFTWEQTAQYRVRCAACCGRRPRRQPEG